VSHHRRLHPQELTTLVLPGESHKHYNTINATINRNLATVPYWLRHGLDREGRAGLTEEIDMYIDMYCTSAWIRRFRREGSADPVIRVMKRKQTNNPSLVVGSKVSK
jgi:hypothetical protein